MGKCNDVMCKVINKNICCGECDRASSCIGRCSSIGEAMTIEDIKECPDYLDV